MPTADATFCVNSAALHAALIVLTLATGCSSPEGASPSGSFEVEVVPPDALRQLGGSDEISRIADVADGSDGTIWVLNTSEPWFVALGADGAVLRAWGRRGGGPGEFRTPNVLVPRPGQVWVYDPGPHQLVRVDGSGNEPETIRVPRESIPMGGVVSTENLGAAGRAWIRGWQTGFLLAVSRTRSSATVRLWDVNLTVLNEDGSAAVAWALGDRLGDPAARYGEQATEILPYPLWAVCPDGTAALYDPLGNAVSRVSGGNATLHSVALPAERRVELTPDRMFRMAYSFMNEHIPAAQRMDSATLYAELHRQWDETRPPAAVLPEYADLQCDGENRLWLQLFDADRGMMGRSPDWLRIDPDGTIRGFRLPETFRPLRFASGRVLGAVRGEYDVESVAWLMLPGG